MKLNEISWTPGTARMFHSNRPGKQVLRKLPGSFRITKDQDTYYLYNGNSIVSRISLFKLRGRGRGYVFMDNVRTWPRYQGQGYIKTLMDHVFDGYKERPVYVNARPGHESIYRSVGFQEIPLDEITPEMLDVLDYHHKALDYQGHNPYDYVLMVLR